jgi:hypothetical protein
MLSYFVIMLRSIYAITSSEITQETGGNSSIAGWKNYRTRNLFLQEDQSLWHAESHKEPLNGVVFFPFAFVLPKDIPSSFYAGDKECKGVISYAIEVVAERLNTFKRNERVGQVFPVVTPADDSQLLEAQKLGGGWDGAMTASSASHHIKKMFWSQFPIAEAHVGVYFAKEMVFTDLFLVTGGASGALVVPDWCANTGYCHHQNQDEANDSIGRIGRVAITKVKKASLPCTAQHRC